EMPNLGTPITATRRSHGSAPWFALGIAALLAGGLGWYSLRPHPPSATPAATFAHDKPAPIKALPSAPSPSSESSATTHPAPKPAASPRLATTIPNTAPAPTALPHPSTPAPAPPPAPPPAPVASTPATPFAPAPPTSPPATAKAASVPAPRADDVPTLDDLPANVRSALPALPITMQVYSADPKHRFVIIDGTRVVEGDSLKGVTVQEIRPDGLVLEFQGRRVLLPRPGS
ncbi:MAG: general secretion pathway protein GspB, partial [Proteobacteria bacterium]|nr:general secretion pathway protein GspB [Pseudomonadota bacterium]